MNEEAKNSRTNHFITLTYDQKFVPRVWDKNDKMYLTLRKGELLTFLNTIKKYQYRNFPGWKMKYYAVGEYGSEEFTTRPHYHLITFDTHERTIQELQAGKMWGKGIVDASHVNGGASAYCAKYIIDRKPFDEDDPRELPFSTMSRGRNGGLGINYMDTNGTWHRDLGTYFPDEMRMYRIENGYMKRLPRYYTNKLKQAREGERQEILDQGFMLYYEELAEKMKADYKRKIEQLSKVHKNPEIYYLEMVKQKYDQVRIKSMKLNKL